MTCRRATTRGLQRTAPHDIVHLSVAIFTVIAIDLILSGDNGVVIALAVKTLPPRLRRRAIVWGGICAAVVQIAAAILASQLLHLEFLQLVGGILILWISLKLVRGAAHPEESDKPADVLPSVWKAVAFIVVANVTMSTDNILAVAAIANGNSALLICGLSVSVPLVVFASGFLAEMMDRYPFLVYVGAAILGKVSGEMIVSDPVTVRLLHPVVWMQYSVEAACALGILVAGLAMAARQRSLETNREPTDAAAAIGP